MAAKRSEGAFGASRNPRCTKPPGSWNALARSRSQASPGAGGTDVRADPSPVTSAPAELWAALRLGRRALLIDPRIDPRQNPQSPPPPTRPSPPAETRPRHDAPLESARGPPAPSSRDASERVADGGELVAAKLRRSVVDLGGGSAPLNHPRLARNLKQYLGSRGFLGGCSSEDARSGKG